MSGPVAIEDIVGRDSLERWLRQEDLPQEAMVALAHRAAMRVLPLAWLIFEFDVSARNYELTALPVLRCALIAGAAARGGAPETKLPPTVFAAADVATTIHAAGWDFVGLAVKAAKAAVAAAAAADRSVHAARAAHATAHAADAFAEAYTADDADVWLEVRADCGSVGDIPAILQRPLWAEGENPLREEWDDVVKGTDLTAAPEWAFWIEWYQRALDGSEDRWDLLREIALLDKDADGADLWEDAGKLAAEIARLQGEYAAARGPSALSQAYPVDFAFDALSRVMRMVGIDDDLAHLRDPAIVQAFLDDCEELRDSLQNFADFSKAGAGGSNLSGMLNMAAQKVLDELSRTRDRQHLRARYLVGLAHRLQAFATQKGARDELGEVLADMLDGPIDLLQSIARKHFGPSYTALAPLSQLSLDQIDQDAVLVLFDQMIERMERLPSNDLATLDEDGLSVFRDMNRELHDYRAAIAEASTDEFREMLESRFAESLGGSGLALGRFLERSKSALGAVDRSTGIAVEQYEKAEKLGDILSFVAAFIKSGAS